MTRIFIDGKAGTTGLKIFSRFQNRPELELIQIDEDKRKDPAERAKCINDSDITFLCLPDPAAIEAAALVTNPKVKLIDTSTAHRTLPDWAYGFPELSPAFREKIASSHRIAGFRRHFTRRLSHCVLCHERLQRRREQRHCPI